MTSNEWLARGWLTEHRSSRGEVADLLALVERDLDACRTPSLPADWRFTIAYNAALQAATLALAVSGYRAAREAHHYRTIQSLAWTIGASEALVVRLDVARRKRNLGAYERAGLVSDQEANEMHALAVELRDRVMDWLRDRHPELLGSP